MVIECLGLPDVLENLVMAPFLVQFLELAQETVGFLLDIKEDVLLGVLVLETLAS